ncbi:hypothetical protein BB558_001093 [Smittium angustum]|uniref:DASH complex subunit DAD3 n=1 Tax=Smittium angustum TaxID=133377 RepID=A0A2U1J559_SMIAN|nr:hypothetical protein BB558_003747 [Smittium angustum]PWA02762.1 hypothetical protein BB558_001093 [Smittium angustum]
MSRLTETEAEILSEYQKINSLTLKLTKTIDDINSEDLDKIALTMRELEKKVFLVYTLFKSSIYNNYNQAESNSNPQESHLHTNQILSNPSTNFHTNCPPF